ncbi:MAG TPA: hypothetical protein VH598_14935, partial [Verrucomicrobiae bacterium]|nr:hypothetical protein [Verrucomicrobiae bacterium]
QKNRRHADGQNIVPVPDIPQQRSDRWIAPSELKIQDREVVCTGKGNLPAETASRRDGQGRS